MSRMIKKLSPFLMIASLAVLPGFNAFAASPFVVNYSTLETSGGRPAEGPVNQSSAQSVSESQHTTLAESLVKLKHECNATGPNYFNHTNQNRVESVQLEQLKPDSK